MNILIIAKLYHEQGRARAVQMRRVFNALKKFTNHNIILITEGINNYGDNSSDIINIPKIDEPKNEFNRFLNYYSKASNINASQDRNARDDDGGRRNGRDRGERGDRSERSERNYDNSNQQRFFVNLGKKDGFNHGALLRLVCDNAGLSKTNVGKIDILNNFSFFEADNSHTSTIIDSLKNVDFEGKEMNVEVTNSGAKSSGSGRSSRSSGGPRREFGKGRDRGSRSGGGSSSRRSYNR